MRWTRSAADSCPAGVSGYSMFMLIFVGHPTGHSSSRVKVVLIWSEIKACRHRVSRSEPNSSFHNQALVEIFHQMSTRCSTQPMRVTRQTRSQRRLQRAQREILDNKIQQSIKHTSKRSIVRPQAQPGLVKPIAEPALASIPRQTLQTLRALTRSVRGSG